MEPIKTHIKAVVRELFDADVEPELTRPDEQFGDYATNVALQLAGKLGKPPREVAEAIAGKLRDEHDESIAKVDIAGPGFINLTVSDAALVQAIMASAQTTGSGEVLVEFGDPNPFKEMHLGHLYTAIVGDSIARLLASGGADVKRLSYHGDVGMHVAKAIWAIKRDVSASGQGDTLADGELFSGSKQAIGSYYALGAKAFDEDEAAAEEIRAINEHVYKQDDPLINEIYTRGSQESFASFDAIFSELGIAYDKRYLESESTRIGIETVKANTGKVFEASEGAIIYRGEKVGLHTRVFINSRGLPTYEAKDLGLAELKAKDFPNARQSIIITAHEQSEYFKVMLAALSEINKPLADATTHLSHGFLSLTTGKMSSRSGDVHTAEALLKTVQEAVTTAYPDTNPANKTYIAAVKYTLIKNRLGGDIIFDVQESVSLEGNSGPYLQYAHARARSILSKADGEQGELTDLQADERSLARKISEYPEVVALATAELMPHHVATYLYELAQSFNRFYENNRVIGDPRQTQRLVLVRRYADVLKDGLGLLGIIAPDHM